jgi:hypothetical protein
MTFYIVWYMDLISMNTDATARAKICGTFIANAAISRQQRSKYANLSVRILLMLPRHCLERQDNDDGPKPKSGIRKRDSKVAAMFRKSRVVLTCFASLALAGAAAAQRVYPLQRQSPEQQRQDEARCSTWAMQESGFDPSRPWLAPQVSASSPGTGNNVRNRSGAVGVMTHRDAGDAVVAGAIVLASTQPSVGTTGNNERARIESAGGAAPAAAVSREAGRAAIAGANAAASTPPAADAAAAAILGGDTSALVAGGAAVAAATARRDTNQTFDLQRAQPVSQQPVAAEALFEKSRVACLEARGYAAQ